MTKSKFRWILMHLGIDIFFFVMFVFCFLANVNIENRGWRVVVMFFCMLSVWFSKVFLLTTYQRSSNNTIITVFMTSMIELGIFLNLYIVGFDVNRTFLEILDYSLGITGIFPVTLCIIAVQYFVNSKNQKTLAGWILSVVSLVGAIVCVYGCPKIESNGDIVKQLVKTLAEILFICAFVVFFDGHSRKFCVDNLSRNTKFYFRFLTVLIFLFAVGAFVMRNQTSFRNAILEVLKVLVLLIFAVFYHQKMNAEPQENEPRKGVFKTLVQVLLVDGVIFLVGFLAGEFGTALILSLFTFLFIYFLFSLMSEEEKKQNQLGSVIALVVVIFILCMVGLYFLCYSIYLKDSVLTIALKNFGLYDKLDRIFNLSDNPQIGEMNTALNESPRLFVALPYNVSLAGRVQTRVEDFSFMNIVTVFGTLMGSVLMLLMVTVPVKMVERIKTKYTGKSIYSVRNLFCIGGCTLFISNTLVHIVANFGLFLFTGVTLPFISNGFMNMAVFYLIFTQVLKKLDTLSSAEE